VGDQDPGKEDAEPEDAASPSTRQEIHSSEKRLWTVSFVALSVVASAVEILTTQWSTLLTLLLISLIGALAVGVWWLMKRRRQIASLSFGWLAVLILLAVLVGAGGTSAIRWSLDGRPFSPPNPTNSASQPPLSAEAATLPASSPPNNQPSDSPTAGPSTTPAKGCTKAGTVEVQVVTPNPLTFCRVLVNDGRPITGPFNLSGQILDPERAWRDLILLVRIDPATCTTEGRRGATGRFMIPPEKFRFGADGTWEYTDDLGGLAAAVTLGRIFEYATAPPAAIQTMAANGDPSGITTLPKDVKILGSFAVAPGTAPAAKACS
jgi:hypothetical protein